MAFAYGFKFIFYYGIFKERDNGLILNIFKRFWDNLEWVLWDFLWLNGMMNFVGYYS